MIPQNRGQGAEEAEASQPQPEDAELPRQLIVVTVESALNLAAMAGDGAAART